MITKTKHRRVLLLILLFALVTAASSYCFELEPSASEESQRGARLLDGEIFDNGEEILQTSTVYEAEAEPVYCECRAETDEVKLTRETLFTGSLSAARAKNMDLRREKASGEEQKISDPANEMAQVAMKQESEDHAPEEDQDEGDGGYEYEGSKETYEELTEESAWESQEEYYEESTEESAWESQEEYYEESTEEFVWEPQEEYCEESMEESLWKEISPDESSEGTLEESTEEPPEEPILEAAEESEAPLLGSAEEMPLESAEGSAEESKPAPFDYSVYSDLDLLAAICQIEAGYNYEGALAVANVVLNRLRGGFADSIYGVIFAPYQFATGDMEYYLTNGTSDIVRQAAQDALNGVNNVGDFLHFNGRYWLDPATLDVPYIEIGGNVFY